MRGLRKKELRSKITSSSWKVWLMIIWIVEEDTWGEKLSVDIKGKKRAKMTQDDDVSNKN
jgi:hypothetical protein